MNDANQQVLMTEERNEKLIKDAFDHLINTYTESRHRKKVEIITKAFNFAKQAHKGVKRLSGEPYILHPIAVAQIACGEMGLGSTSICAALLHDVVEDTDYTVEDIENIFGEKIAQIVDGLTKISGGIFGDQASAQAENFKKLLLTMSEDIRVILIKICDRLHNMRTLDSQPANKQYKIAGETLYVYAPLANRLGLNKIKTELENLSFKFEHKEEFERINQKLSFTKEQRDELFEQFTRPIREVLDGMGINYQIKERVKSPFSIWHKMQTKHLTFEEIYDILAVRIIFKPTTREDEINECFNIYVAISKIYKSHPDRLRDWLNHPKANGYQALHVTLMSKMGRWIEVQIRSDRMDELAEEGFAAHWKYKEGGEYTEDESELNKWLHTIKEILDDPQPDAMDFLDAIKLNLFASEIFVFTPKGEIKTMPADCTALDFAFRIHTFLGSHCIGAKVNHKLVPISHKLQSGDQVEIITSVTQHVQPEWIQFVSTAKAKAKIQAILRRHDRETQKQGECILRTWLQRNNLSITTNILEKLYVFHHLSSAEELFTALGKQVVVLSDKDLAAINNKTSVGIQERLRKFVPFLSIDKKKSKETPKFVVGKDFNKKKPIIINEENIRSFIFKPCCHSIPGDDVLGFIDDKQHVEIHKRSCSVADKLKTSYGNRILDAQWDMHKRLFFNATIKVRGIDRQGLLFSVSEIISSQMNINIHKITISTEEGIFDGTIEIGVHDKEEANELVERLKTVDSLTEVNFIG